MQKLFVAYIEGYEVVDHDIILYSEVLNVRSEVRSV